LELNGVHCSCKWRLLSKVCLYHEKSSTARWLKLNRNSINGESGLIILNRTKKNAKKKEKKNNNNNDYKKKKARNERSQKMSICSISIAFTNLFFYIKQRVCYGTIHYLNFVSQNKTTEVHEQFTLIILII